MDELNILLNVDKLENAIMDGGAEEEIEAPPVTVLTGSSNANRTFVLPVVMR